MKSIDEVFVYLIIYFQKQFDLQDTMRDPDTELCVWIRSKLNLQSNRPGRNSSISCKLRMPSTKNYTKSRLTRWSEMLFELLSFLVNLKLMMMKIIGLITGIMFNQQFKVIFILFLEFSLLLKITAESIVQAYSEKGPNLKTSLKVSK